MTLDLHNAFYLFKTKAECYNTANLTTHFVFKAAAEKTKIQQGNSVVVHVSSFNWRTAAGFWGWGGGKAVRGKDPLTESCDTHHVIRREPWRRGRGKCSSL